MSMQRRHYNAIAAALRSGNTPLDIIATIAWTLHCNNPRFDYDKFTSKATTGPTQEQRSAKYRRAILLRHHALLGIQPLPSLTRCKPRATPRPNSATIAAQHGGVGGVSPR